MQATRLRVIPIAVISTALMLLLAVTAQTAFAAEDAKAADSGGIQAYTLKGGDAAAADLKGSLETQASYRDYLSPDGLVGVYGITAGSARYDSATRTLTLDGVKAKTVGFRKSGAVTVRLVGSNYTRIEDDEFSPGFGRMEMEPESRGSVKFKGYGSLKGEIELEGDVTVRGGTITASGYENDDLSCRNFTMSGGTVNVAGDLDCEGKFTMSGGKLTVSKGIDCERTFSMKGGTVKASAYGEDGISCHNFTMTKGTVTATNRNGTDDGIDCDAEVSIKGGTVTATGKQGISCRTFAISKGTVKATGKGYNKAGINAISTSITGGSVTAKGAIGVATKSFSISKKGKLTISKADTGIKLGARGASTSTMKVKGGSISISNASSYGIRGFNSNLMMTGGTLAVTKSHGAGIDLGTASYTGGKVTVTGGKLTSTVRTPSEYDAIVAKSMTNKVSCLKSIKGALPKGASFKVNGKTHKVSSTGTIVVKYGGVTYHV